MRQPSESDPMSSSNGSYVWILSTAIVVTILFVSFALYFSRSKAVTQTLNTSGTVTNQAPTISAVRIDTLDSFSLPRISGDCDATCANTLFGQQLAIVPTAGQTLSAYIDIIAQDANGFQDIDLSAPQGPLMHLTASTTFGTTQAPDCINPNTCYVTPSGTVSNCSVEASNTNTVQYRCTIALESYMHSGAWVVVPYLYDTAGAVGTFTQSFTVDPVLGYRLYDPLNPSNPTPSIDFGSLPVPYAFGIGANVNKELTVQNIANTAFQNLAVSTTDMTCTTNGSIPAADVGFGLGTLTSLISGDGLTNTYVPGTNTGTSLAFSLPPQTSELVPELKSFYNHIVAVPLDAKGTCTGSIDVTPAI